MTESPKELFLMTQKEAADAMKVIAGERSLKLAVAFTLSQLAHDGITQEQLAGAKRFADILMTIGEPNQKIPDFPARELKNG